jgi:hypothetical protein
VATIFNAQQSVVAASPTDDSGRFRLSLPPSTYALQVTKSGFSSQRLAVN